MNDYRPTVDADDAERMRGWHDEHYAILQETLDDPREFDYLGLRLLIPPHVQIIESTSDLLGKLVLAETRPDDRVLDVGTGSGVNAILAATISSDVLAVDVNPVAVEAARANAERNGVADRVEVRESDVFSAVEGTFDLIIFDPPFRWFRPRDWAEAAITDENYRALRTFFEQVRGHLADGGRVLMFFGTTGDIGYVEGLMTEDFAVEVMDRRPMAKDGVPVEYRAYRLEASPRR